MPVYYENGIVLVIAGLRNNDDY